MRTDYESIFRLASGDYESKVERYIGNLEQTLIRASHARGRAWEALFDEFLALIDAPSPDPAVRPYFHHGEVLRFLAEALFVPYSERLRNAIDRVTGREFRRIRAPFYRVRRLGPLGVYPNLEVASGRAEYVIRAGQPYIVTVNSPQEEDRWSFGSDLSDWTRHEVRMAAAISTAERGGFTTYLGTSLDFLVTQVDHVPREVAISFMVDCAHLRDRREQPDVRLARPFEFSDYRPFRSVARAFGSHFLVSHPLLLRTATLFVKATMLWRSDGLEEDAVASLLFALEGCLLLFQDIDGLTTDRIDRKRLRAIFDRTFQGGSALYDFIDDAMGWGGTRARVVHPQLSLLHGWRPSLQADDYFEYNRVVRLLLRYLVTGDTLAEFELRE